MGSKLRVLMLTGFPAIGGPLPKLAPLVADGLRRCGCEVIIEGWSAHTAGHEALAAKVAGRSADLLRVHRRVRTWRPDVVYVATSHNWPALLRDVPLGLTVPRSGPPLVLHLHGSECDKLGLPGKRVFTALSRWLMRRMAAVLLLSTEELETWQHYCPGVRFEVVLNPFVPAGVAAAAKAAAPATGADPPSPTLLFIGRLVPEKGIFDLLDALTIVRRHRPCRLAIAGMGPARDDIERRVSLLGLDGDVSLLGYVTGADLQRAYHTASAFVLPSWREGFPLVVMEAMGYGLPVITTPIRGCADHLTPDENALFAPPRDPEALAGQIERLLDDPGLQERMGAANRAKVAQFAPDAVVPRYAEILRSVTPGARGDL